MPAVKKVIGHLVILVALGALFSTTWACSSIQGNPLDESALGYQECTSDRSCGKGRYCNKPEGKDKGYCWQDCRPSEDDKDCALIGDGLECTVFGRCVPKGQDFSCMNNSQCEEGYFCNIGVNTCQARVPCNESKDCDNGSVCMAGMCVQLCGIDIIEKDGIKIEKGRHQDCPKGTYCNAGVKARGKGTCSPLCRDQEDCAGYSEDVQCTPIGLCLEPGIDWYEPDECRWVVDGVHVNHYLADSPCLELGFNYGCRPGADVSTCAKLSDKVDLGKIDPAYDASKLAGIWGIHFQTSTINDIPLVGSQDTVSSNTGIARLTHNGNKVTMEIKICKIDLINFWDDDKQHENLSWMIVPKRYVMAVPVVVQDFTIDKVEKGATFTTSWVLDVRGAILDDPKNDPLPTKKDLTHEWDQDLDGNPGMTTVMEGLLHGDVYNVQKWGDSKHGVILDDQANYIGGLMESMSIQEVLGGNPPDLGQNADISIHPMADRTFFRMARMPDNTTCADVIERSAKKGDWLSYTPHYGDVQPPAD
ncbi:MAG: hypothetical protein GXP49_09785 [Deltaproteobacteria bacterium]|nr:hypothetical protein [Deltaproteobacteria bacterium]